MRKELSRTDLVEQADVILRANGSMKLVRRGFRKEVFDPFAPIQLRGKERTFDVGEMERLRRAGFTQRAIARALDSDQASVSYYLACNLCTRCRLQRVIYSKVCSACKRNEFAMAMEYWEKLYWQFEPDFAPELIEQITDQEMELGVPVALWKFI